MFINKDIKSSVHYNNNKKEIHWVYTAGPGTVLGAGNPVVDKIQNPCYQRAYIPVDGGLWIFLVLTKNFLNGNVLPFHYKKKFVYF